MKSTTLKQLTKDERLNQWKPKISCKPVQNFVQCSHFKFISFLCPQNCSSLFAVSVRTFISCHPTCFSLFCVFASVQVHERKRHSCPAA